MRAVLLGRADWHDHRVVGLQEGFDFRIRHLAEKNGCWFHGRITVARVVAGSGFGVRSCISTFGQNRNVEIQDLTPDYLGHSMVIGLGSQAIVSVVRLHGR